MEADYLTSYAVQDALAEAALNFGKVYVLLNRASPGAAKAKAWLSAHHVHVRYASPRLGFLHAKWMADSEGYVLDGSANFSLDALGAKGIPPRNHEMDILLQDQPLANAFMAKFKKDWRASA